MNSTILFSLVLVVVSAVCIHGAPTDSELSFENLSDPVSPVHGERQRRVTCDLLSINTPLGSLNHAACAANCLAMGGGRRGGRCINGVCNCRF